MPTYRPARRRRELELAARRRGYASEAAAALVTWALEQPGVETIVAACDADNATSILTLDRIGFRRTGGAEGRILWTYGQSTRHELNDT
jgi:RimJ/RimL family protein N-acetyltransferase